MARLHRRTWHGAVGAKYAAVARLGLQPFATALAIIEELAGVGRHDLGCLMTAFRTGQHRFQPRRLACASLREAVPFHSRGG